MHSEALLRKVNYFVFPARVILTGTEGIAASLSYYFESQTLFIFLHFVFQALLLVFSYFLVGRTFSFRTFIVVGVVITSLTVLPD